jgi:flagellin
MSLGVLNNLSAMYAENSLNNTTNSLNTVLQQLSSGSKINSGADDAAGLSLVDGLQANSQALAQSQTNAQEGVGLLQVADGALSQVTSLLNRAVTLATEASNGTLNSSQDSAANQEYQSILSEVSNIGSTTTYNGNQVFNSSTNIYTGDSTSQGASVDALNIRSLSSSNVGDTGGVMAYSNGANNVFVDLSSGGTAASVSDSLGKSTATTSLAVNYLTKGTNGATISATANISVGAGTSYANTAQGMISAINGSGLGLTASFGTAIQAGTAGTSAATSSNTTGSAATDTGIIISGQGVGAGTNGAGEIGTMTLAGATDTLGGTLNITGSNGVSQAMTLGTTNSTDTLANLASTINASGDGITASLNTSIVGGNAIGTVLSFTSGSSAATVSATSLTDTPSGTATAALVASTIATSAAAGTIGVLTVDNSATTLAGTLNIVGILGTNTALTLGTAGTTDNLKDLTAYINTGGGVAAGQDVSATLNTAGTVMTLAITAANGAVAAATTSVTSLVASHSAASTTLTGTPITTGSTNSTVGTLTATTSTGTLGGTLNIGANSGITLGTATGNAKTDTMADLAATINAGDYGVTASLNKAGTIMTFSSANSADTFSITSGTESGGGATLTGTTAVANHAQIGTVSFTGTTTGAATTDDLTSGNTLTVAGTTFTVANGTTTLGSFASTINAANLGVNATVTTSGSGITAAETLTLTSTSAASQGDGFTATMVDSTIAKTGASTVDTPSTTNSAYYSVGISGSIADTTTGGGSLNTGLVGDNNGKTGTATISYSDAAGSSLSSTDLSNQQDAQATLTSLNAAITDVAAQDGYVGAQINTLNAVSSVLSTQQENVTSAQNAVQATDYASATSNMSKYEILSQTGISALAQANSMSQEVTKLLQ